MSTPPNLLLAQPGAVITVDFPGITGIKRRPAIVVSTDLYHRTRPDVLLGLVTSQITSTMAPSDCILQDWQIAGLRKPSIFRTFLLTKPFTDIVVIGQLSAQDWQMVQSCLRNALSVGG